jgi:hypothetical protein
MPRNYERKNVSRAEQTKEALAVLIQQKSNPDRLPKSTKGFPKLLPSWFEHSGFYLRYWLDESERTNDSDLYSMLLQIWLHLNGISWPKGVFKTELKAGRGRPLSDLGFRALHMLRPGCGFEDIAKVLVPEKYATNQKEAIKYIKDLATSAKNAPDHDSALEEALKLGSLLLGIKKSTEENEEADWRSEYSLLLEELGEDLEEESADEQGEK